MPIINCLKYFDQNILPFADFLHTPTSFPLTKKATKSYLGIFLSLVMISFFIALTIREFFQYDKNYIINYSQGFIEREEWANKTITFGFNVLEEWENEVSFKMVNSKSEEINLTRCNENLIESENGKFYCLLNTSLELDSSFSHVFKLLLYLKKNLTEYEPLRIPFTLLIPEPKISHDNFGNPIESSIENFTCFYNTEEITTFRRYLKLIQYKTEKIYFYNYNDNRYDEKIYLDDFEDSRKLDLRGAYVDEGNFLGTFRIMVSKKVDIYERKYLSLPNLFSKIGGFLSSLRLTFSIICLIIVNPNDNYRIFNYLKKKGTIRLNNDLKSIYDDSKIEKKLDKTEFNERIMNNKLSKILWNKFCYFFCRFFSCYKRTQHLSIINQYIYKNLTIENYLENQVMIKELMENIERIDDLKVKYLHKYKRKKGSRFYTIKSRGPSSEDIQIDPNIEPLMNQQNIEMEMKGENNFHGGTVYIDNDIKITSFNEKQKEDIIRVVLEKLF